MDTEKKILWVAVLFAFSPLAIPFYWWMYIWKDKIDQKSELNQELRYESSGTES